MTIETLDNGSRTIARKAVVNAPATEIFALLSDPHRHHEVDGSGTVKDKVKGPHELELGAKFNVAMKQFGMPYKITSKVVAFEKDRLIEWRHPAGHTWRWELTPASDSTTEVIETWDASSTPAYPMFKAMGMTGKNATGIENSLRGLQERFS